MTWKRAYGEISGFFVTLLLLLTLIIPAFDKRVDLLNIANAEVASAGDDNGFWYDMHGDNIIDGVGINYSSCWIWMRQHLNYTIEYSRNGLQWFPTGGLQAVFHNVSNDTRKLTLIFNATNGNPTASYRLTCLFPAFVKDFFSLDRDKHLLTIQYMLFGHPLQILFNYTDLLNQGLTFTWGNNSNTFWFRMQKNNLANGRYVLDPFYKIISAGTNLATAWAGGGKIVRLSNGTMVCVYRKISTVSQIYLSHSFDNGLNWKVTKVLTNYAIYNAIGPAIAVNSTDICHIVWCNQTGASAGKIMYVSYNDALNTTSSLSFNCSGIKYKGQPRSCSIAIDSSDNIHVVYKQAGNGSSSPMYTVYTKKTGASWSSPRLLQSGDAGTSSVPTIVVNATNSLFVFYDYQNSATDYRINCIRYWSGNATWSSVRTISSTYRSANNRGPTVSFYRNGSMILVWYGNNTGSNILQIKYVKSTNGFSSWSAPRNITNGAVASTFQNAPSIAIDNGTTQTAHVVWYGDTVALSLYKPRYSNSTDFGTTWTTPINLSSTTGHTYPVMLWSWYPIVSGLHLNIPKKDYCFVWTNNSVVQFYKSPSLSLYLPTDEAPQINSPSPANASTGVSFSLSNGVPLAVTVIDRDNLTNMNIYWWTNESGSWVLKQTNATVRNGTYRYVFTDAVKQRYCYGWKVSANDGYFNTTKTFYFYTQNILPYISNMLPTNGSVNRDIATRDVWTNVSVAEQSHEKMNVTFYSNATKTFTSHAMGVGNSTNLNAYGDSPNWACVDDTVLTHIGSGYFYSDNDTTYVANDQLVYPGFKNDTYIMQNHTTESYTIYNLTLYASTYFVFSDVGSSGGGYFVVVTHGHYYYYVIPTIGWDTWEEERYDLPTNPFTGNPWTWDEVDKLNVGVKITGFDTALVSSVYFKVNPAWDMSNPSGHYRRYGYNASVQNASGNVYTARWNNSNFSEAFHTYYWFVTVGDGYGTNTSPLFHFQTRKIGVWRIINSSVNGSVYNASIWRIISSSLNGSVYNLSSWKIISSYLNGSIYNDSEPNITFVSQVPPDITSINILGHPVNITYNITDTDGTPVDNTTVYIHYKTNRSSGQPTYYVNGTVFNTYLRSHYNYSHGTLYSFLLKDNQIYPATYNFNENKMENTVHTTTTLSTTARYLSIELLNVSNTCNYSFFEIMANNTGTSGIRIYYANSSYAFNSNPATSPYCVLIYTIPGSNPYNHTHTIYSKHQIVPFAINKTTGKVGNVLVTPKSYFIVRGNAGAVANHPVLYHIANVSRANAMRESINNGISWTNQAFTMDAHLHQYNGTDTFYYYVTANDTKGQMGTSSTRSDRIDLAGLVPTVVVYTPISQNYTGLMNVTYHAESPNGYAIMNYSVSLLNNADVLVSTITASTMNQYVVWNTTTVYDGEYKIRVYAYDSLSQKGTGYSELFNITNAHWRVINNSMNGSIYNASLWRIIDSSLNGSIYNATPSWRIISSSLNGSVYNETEEIIFSHEYPVNGSINVNYSAMTGTNTSIMMNYTGRWNITQEYENYFDVPDALDGDEVITGSYVGMNFTVGYSSINETAYLVNVSLYLQKQDFQPGILGPVLVSIRDADYLNGPDISTGSMAGEDVAPGGFAWYNISMTTCPLLKGHQYKIIVTNTNAPATNRYLIWGVVTSGSYAKGNYSKSDDGTTWYNLVGVDADCCFKIWSTNKSVDLNFLSNSSGSWLNYSGPRYMIQNGTVNVTGANFTDPSTTYWWKVNGTLLSKGAVDFYNDSGIYHFTTKGAEWHVINSSLNGSIYNITSWRVIDSSLNGSVFNATAWRIIDDTLNGSVYNLTSWRTINASLNGSIYNITSWMLIDASINGSIYNLTNWRVIDSSLNGSIFNETKWNIIDSSLNGSIYNLTSWRVIDSSLNGSIFNATAWRIIDDTLNGSVYNVTSWRTIDDTLNGSLYNITNWRVIDSSLNGSIYNITSWMLIDASINGSIYNLTNWRTIDSSFNGSIYNVSNWVIIDNHLNGSIYNISAIWHNVSTDINGSIYNVSKAILAPPVTLQIVLSLKNAHDIQLGSLFILIASMICLLFWLRRRRRKKRI